MGRQQLAPEPLPALPGAACSGERRPLWDDVVHGESPQERHSRHVQARDICAGCPVRVECAASRGPTDHGIWGGQLYRGAVYARTTTPRAGSNPRNGSYRVTRCAGCRQPMVDGRAWRRYPWLQREHVAHRGRGVCERCAGSTREAG